MQIPSRQELRRLFAEDNAERVHFAETVLSWPSLRIIDLLYGEEPLSTGQIARELNIDMRDAKDILEALEAWDIVKETDDGWRMAVECVTVRIGGDDGIDIECTVAASPDARSAGDHPTYQEITNARPSESEPAVVDEDTTGAARLSGILNWVVQKFKRLIK